jgi:O-antigen chain-terminating methyltransferase
MKPFDYSDYESRLMDSQYIRMLQKERVRFFQGCKRVLDLACGPGIFLELLREAGIEASGVDRNEKIVQKARQKGLNLVHSDIFDYLEKNNERFGGIFCSHLLEHLPFERVVRLIELISGKLERNGILVFVLPNPGSIRLHLFGFWRDPEHVRFYTGNLIASVCQHNGLNVEYSNEEETPNLLETPRLEPISLPPSLKGWRGLVQGPKDEMRLFLHEFNKQVEAFNQKIEKFSETLNKIWSRDDEVVIVCRKTE